MVVEHFEVENVSAKWYHWHTFKAMLLPSQRSREANVSHLQMRINCCWQQRARFPSKLLQQLYAGCRCLEEDSSFWQGAGLPSRGLPAGDRVPSLAVRSPAAKQLWGRAPLSGTSYLLDKNPLNTPESHAVTPPVFGTRSPKFVISQQERNGLRSAARLGLRGEDGLLGWARLEHLWARELFHGAFLQLRCCRTPGFSSRSPPAWRITGQEAGYQHPRQGLLCGGWYLYTPLACLGSLQRPG